MSNAENRWHSESDKMGPASVLGQPQVSVAFFVGFGDSAETLRNEGTELDF